MQTYIRPQATTTLGTSTVASMPYTYSAARPVTTSAPATYTVQAPTYSTIASQPATTYSTIGATSLPATTYPAATVISGAPAATVISGARPMTIGTTQLAAQPVLAQAAQPMVTQMVAPQMVAPQVLIPGQPVAATYLGGPAVATQTANLLAAGRVVSVREVPMEECYTTGLVRTEAMPQPQAFTEIVQVQPIVETVVGADGQMQLVQAEVVTDTVVTAEGQVMVETMVEGGVPVEAVQQETGPPRVVIVCTSANQMGEQPTGAWSEEITGPYYVFTEAGCEVYIASIMGGKVPIDEGSLSENFLTGNDQRFQEEGCTQFLDTSYAIGDVSAEAIDCVWLAGGHGTCMDFEANLAQFVTDAHALGRPIGAVCHGVIGLLSAVAQDGTPLLAGKQVTGFSNAEEEQVGLLEKVPFLVQQRMEELQAAYSCAEPWNEYAIRDGKIITGQNPQSSVRAAQLCVEAMMQP